MLRLSPLLVVVALFALGTLSPGQSDAQAAYQAGREAFDAERFDAARDAFEGASITDSRNAEVWLWLGKSHYALGGLDEALSAFRKTLELAPNEPHARRMVDALSGTTRSAAHQLALIKQLVAERRYKTARRQIAHLRAGTALNDHNQVETSMLQAEAEIGARAGADAALTLGELVIRYPAQATVARVRFLEAVLSLLEKRQVTAALATLDALAAESDVALAARAALARIEYGLDLGASAKGLEALRSWIATHGNHPSLSPARHRFIRAALVVANQNATSGEALDPWELRAIEIASAEMQSDERGERRTLGKLLIGYFEKRYKTKGRLVALVAAMEGLAELPHDRGNRRRVLAAIVHGRVEIAARLVDTALRARRLDAAPSRELPLGVGQALDAVQRFEAAFPEEPRARDLVTLAQEITKSADGLELAPADEAYGWACGLAETAISANRDPKARDAAVSLIDEIGARASRDGTVASRRRHLTLFNIALGHLEDEVARRQLWRKLALTDELELAIAKEQRALGRPRAPLGDRVAAAAAVLAEIARDRRQHDAIVKSAPQRDAARRTLDPEAADEILRRSAALLDGRHAGELELALVDATIARLAEHLADASKSGLMPDDDVRDQAQRAMASLYHVHRLGATEFATVDRARTGMSSLVEILRRHERQEEIDAILGATYAPSYAAGDLALAFVRAVELHSRFTIARARDRLPPATRAAEKLGAAAEQVMAAYEGVAKSPLVDSLISRSTHALLEVARDLRRETAYTAALEAFERIESLARANAQANASLAPEPPTLAESAAWERSETLRRAAQAALDRELASRRPDESLPQEASPEFVAVIASHRRSLERYPESAYARGAPDAIRGIALVYARSGAWRAAGDVFLRLENSGLKLLHSERLLFARALCRIGEVDPGHALQILEGAVVNGRYGRSKQPKAERSKDGKEQENKPAPTSGPGRAAAGLELSPGGKRVGLIIGHTLAKTDQQLLAAIKTHNSQRVQIISQIRDGLASIAADPDSDDAKDAGPSEAELARQQAAIDAAYALLTALRQAQPNTVVAEQARAEVLLLVTHWRSLNQWDRARALLAQFLDDIPKDPDLAQLRFDYAEDALAKATRVPTSRIGRIEAQRQIVAGFDSARSELNEVAGTFGTDHRDLARRARWRIAESHLTQARVIARISPTLARGQYVRAGRALQAAARSLHDHPEVSTVPTILTQIAEELVARGAFEEAITVWNDLTVFAPASPLARASAPRVAQTFQSIGRPLPAVEKYIEIFFSGGADGSVQPAIFQIGAQLRAEQRWVESLHVMETFVACFPRHARAGQALTMVGEIHQANEAWEDAIAAYGRVLDEYPDGNWMPMAKWSIAECKINLSHWTEAIRAYEGFIDEFAKDARAMEASRRIAVLKDVERYQILVDEQGQRKAFDAQFQIAGIVREKLQNGQKAIIEFKKVAALWPTCHLADDALYAVGQIYLSMNQRQRARDSMLDVARRYPSSPLADDALFDVGNSYETEAAVLGTITAVEALDFNIEIAQSAAYTQFQGARREQRAGNEKKIAKLKGAGEAAQAEVFAASNPINNWAFDNASAVFAAQAAQQFGETMTAIQMADRQDKTKAALRAAVRSYAEASRIAGGDKAGDALLRMATIYDQKLKDSMNAMKTWTEIVRQFSGTAVAEDASWRLAKAFERAGDFAKAIDAHQAFLRNYRRSQRAAEAQFAVAENYEVLGKWVQAMDAYTNYLASFPNGPHGAKAKTQISWLKQYRL